MLGDRQVLHGVDAALGARQVVAVLGPNGSGKTTLFRTAMSLVLPDAGRVLLDGTDARDTPIADLARSIGYVFQSPSQMLFARTVREELLFGPRNLGLDLGDPDGVAMDALRRTGLAEEDGDPRSSADDPQLRPAEAAGAGDRPRASAQDAHPR